MLFISLLFFLVMWIPCYKYVIPLLNLSGYIVWFSLPVLYIIAYLLSLLLVYLMHSFNPEAKPFFRRVIRIKGIRWIAFMTGAVAIIALISIIHFKGAGIGIYGILLPTIIVSFLNAINAEIFPNILIEEEIAPRLVTRREIAKPEIPEDIVRKFQWEHKGQTYEIELVIRRLLYDDYCSRNRVQYGEWAKEYAAGGICGEIRELAYKLLSIGKPYGTYEEVEFVLSFVQQAITYQTEKGEYPRYPIESLVDEVGDCEDFSILGASILKLMGYEVALLMLPRHAALGVAGAEGIPGVYVEHKDNRYYYCEMTNKGWDIGQIPEECANQKIDVYPVPGVILRIDQPVNT